MLVEYFKIKNISNNGRAIALSLVGGIFLIISFIAVWNRNFSDTLINYIPNDATFYAHFSKPKIKSSEDFNRVLSQIFADLDLPNYEDLSIGREVAIVGHSSGQYCLIVNSDSPTKTKNILNDNKKEYLFLSSTRVVVCDDHLLDDYQKNKNNNIAVLSKRRFSPLNSLSVFISQKFIKDNDQNSLIGILSSFVSDENGNILLNFKIKKDGINISSYGKAGSITEHDFFLAKSPEQEINADIVFAVSDLQRIFTTWKNKLQGVSESDYNIFINTYLNTYLNANLPSGINNLFLIVNKNETDSDWIFGKNNFYTALTGVEMDDVEKVLKDIMASEYPIVKTIYLSDGTPVRELYPNPDDFYFVDINGVKTLYSPDGKFKFMYRVEGDVIIVSNNDELINRELPEIGINYFKLSTDRLSKEGIWHYLKGFNNLEISEEGLFLR